MKRVILALVLTGSSVSFSNVSSRAALGDITSCVMANRDFLSLARKQIQEEINSLESKNRLFKVSCLYNIFGNEPVLLSTKKDFSTYRKDPEKQDKVIDAKYSSRQPDKVIEVVYTPSKRLLSLIHRPVNKSNRRIKTESIKLPAGYFI